MKALFSTLIFLFLLAENAQAQVVLLDVPAEHSQLSQESIIPLDLKFLAAVKHLQVELWQKEEMVDFVVLPAGTLVYEWQLNKQKVAKNYQIRIVNQKDGALLAKSERFSIGKTSLAMASKIGAIASVPIAILSGRIIIFRHGVLGPPKPLPVR